MKRILLNIKFWNCFFFVSNNWYKLINKIGNLLSVINIIDYVFQKGKGNNNKNIIKKKWPGAKGEDFPAKLSSQLQPLNPAYSPNPILRCHLLPNLHPDLNLHLSNLDSHPKLGAVARHAGTVWPGVNAGLVGCKRLWMRRREFWWLTFCWIGFDLAGSGWVQDFWGSCGVVFEVRGLKLSWVELGGIRVWLVLKVKVFFFVDKGWLDFGLESCCCGGRSVGEIK